MPKRSDRGIGRPGTTIVPGLNSAFPPAPNYDQAREPPMAKRVKGPRRPKGVNVVHHVHHAAPSMRAFGGGLVRRPAMAAPVARVVRPMMPPIAPPMGRPVMPMARPMGPVMPRPVAPMGAPLRPPGMMGVPPAPAMGAPRAPLPGPMGPMGGPFGPRRF